MKELGEMYKYAGMGGAGLALLLPLLGVFGINLLAGFAWLVPVLGLVAGWGLKPSTSLLLAGLVLATFAGALATIPMVGSIVNAVFASLVTFVGAVIAVPAARIVLKRFGIKF